MMPDCNPRRRLAGMATDDILDALLRALYAGITGLRRSGDLDPQGTRQALIEMRRAAVVLANVAHREPVLAEKLWRAIDMGDDGQLAEWLSQTWHSMHENIPANELHRRVGEIDAMFAYADLRDAEPAGPA